MCYSHANLLLRIRIGAYIYFSALSMLAHTRLLAIHPSTDRHVCVIALLCYDYVVTFDQEISVIWQRKWTGATWLFISNRYAALLLLALTSAPTNTITVRPSFSTFLVYSTL